MSKLYKTVDEIVLYHDNQEKCIWQNEETDSRENECQLNLERLHVDTIFKYLMFTEGSFREMIWGLDSSQDKIISLELQKELKHRQSIYTSFEKILEALNKIFENSATEQLGLPSEIVKRLRSHIDGDLRRGIRFRNWYVHGMWDIEKRKEIFDSPDNIELTKLQDLHRNQKGICRDFEKHIFNQTKKI